MKKNSKAIALILSLLMVAIIAAACGPAETGPAGGPAAPAPGPGGDPAAPAAPPAMVAPAEPDPTAIFSEHIDIIQDNTTIGVLNPFLAAANTSATNWAFIMFLDRLLERNHAEGGFFPSLALEYITEDYQTFIFPLRDDVYFHNGDHFTAEDVVFTIELSREIGAGSPGAAQWAPVESARAIDSYTLEIVLNAVQVDFPFNTTFASAGIVNRRAVEADSDRGFWVGTGAFEVAEFIPLDFIRFVRNDNFWNTDMNIMTPSVTLRFVPEMSARTIRMQVGESQLSFGTSAEDLPLFQADPDNFEVYAQTFNNPQGLSFNLNDPITGDLYFRRAVAHAIDKYEVAIMAAGEWAAADYSGTLWGFSTEFKHTGIEPLLFDQDLARYYLEKSVYNGEEVELAAAILTNVRAAQSIQQQLSRVGINTRIAEFDSAGLAAYMSPANPDNPSQLIKFNLIINPSAASVRPNFYPGGALNRMFFNNEEVTRLLDEVGGVFDRAERERIFLRIQEVVAEYIPFINMYWRINGILAARGVGGLNLPSDHHQTDLRQIFHVIGYE